MRLIGDVHGKHDRYLPLISGVKESIQVGDFGFKYDVLNQVDSVNHRILAGNHDNHDLWPTYPHFLGNYGNWRNWYYVRGGRSVDKELRTENINYWPQEELSLREMCSAADDYAKARPEFVVTHECPAFLIAPFGNKGYSVTAQFLQRLFDIHRPKIWVFGHHHRSFTQYFGETKFICLNELETVDVCSE